MGEAAAGGSGVIKLRDPTPEERASLQQVVNNPLDLAGMQRWLDAHPGVRVDGVVDTQTGNTMYASLLFDGRVRSTDPILLEVLRREPDPTKPNRFRKTAATIAEERASQFMRPDDPNSLDWQTKAQNARLYEKRWKVRGARDAVALASASKYGLPQPNRYVEGQVSSFLTGEVGSVGAQISKLRTKAGLPGVPGGSRRTQKHRRRHRSRKTKSRR